MIDARTWRRPSPDELRAMIPNGLSQLEIAARLGRPERAVRYWFSRKADVPKSRRIDFCEWVALRALAEEVQATPPPTDAAPRERGG